MNLNERAVFLGCFLILAIYHILVYIGRRKDVFNLIYSLYCLSIANVVLGSMIFFNRLDSPGYAFYFTISCHFIAGTLMLFVHIFLDIIKTKPALFSLVYYLFLNVFLIVLVILAVIHKNHFILYIYSPALFILGLFLIVFVIRKYIKERRTRDRKNAIITAGFILVIIYLMIIAVLIFLKINIPHISVYTVFLINALLFAYALTDSFNQEHKDLMDMKKNLEDKVGQRTKQLEDANRQKTTFFINLAHEMKTPLTLIDNYLDNDMIKRGSSLELDIVKKNVNKLKNDMVNYLDFEKLENKMVFYDHDRIINLSEMIEEKIVLFQNVAKKINIEILSTISEGIHIKIDPFAMDRILNNLLDNAIKYNRENGRISIALEQKKNKARFVISDTGIGISESQIENIFEPFHQISHEKRNYQGIGMGLSIVKKILDDIDGKIVVDSKIGSGTEFQIILKSYDTEKDFIAEKIPLTLPFSEINYNRNQTKEQSLDKNKKNILIVEDNPEMSNFLYDTLKEYYNTFISENGRHALELINKIPKPDLIMSDIMMDKMDGYEFFDELSFKSEFSSVPFIFLTAKTSKSDKIEGLKMGAIDYINKPFSMEELTFKIESIINLNERQRKNNINEIKSFFSNVFDGHFNNSSSIQREQSDFNGICDENDINKNEKQVIKLLLKGLEYKEIGYELNISINIVKKRIHSIYNKMKVKNKVELVNIFRDIQI